MLLTRPILISKIKCKAQTKCEIDGNPCSDLVINGTEATKDGVANYPNVTIDYTLKICNYNDVDMRFARSIIDSNGEVEHRSYMEFWYQTPGENGETERINIFPKKIYNNTNEILVSKSCEKERGSVQVSTTTSKFFMQSSLQGPLSILDASDADKFCYAYSFNPVELNYDYGDPPCEMSVSTMFVLTGFVQIYLNDLNMFFHSQTEASCVVAPGQDGEGMSCHDYMANMTDSNFRVFQGTYSWKVT